MFKFQNKEVETEYWKQYARYLQQLREGWDVVLPPEEMTPIPVADARADETIANWGIDYLLQGDDILERVIENAKKKGLPPVFIVIGDTAPWFDHEDLQPLTDHRHAADFVTIGRADKNKDANGHGTHCAGIIAAKSSKYKLGVITKLAEAGLIRLVPNGFLNDQGSGAYSWIENGIRNCIEIKKKTGANVILSMSLGGSSQHDGMKRAIDDFIKTGGFVSASAGNRGGDGSASTMGFPGNYPPVMGIASIDQNGLRSAFSSTGNLQDERIWNTAPGGNILSTYRDNSYAYLNGTSMSNPHSAAIDAALLLAFGDVLKSQDALKEYKAKFASDLGKTGYDVFYGYGAPKLRNYFEGVPDPEPEPEPERPDFDETFSFNAKASVVFKDHESTPGYITGSLAGYTLDVSIEIAIMDTDKVSEKLQRLQIQVMNYFNFFQSMVIESRQDANRTPSNRKVFIDGPVNLKTIAQYFAQMLQATIDKNLDFDAVIVSLAIDDNFGRNVEILID